MTVRFMARVLMELGAELISSDAVAVYELVKNSIDAGSKTVKLDVTIVMQWSVYQELREYLLIEDDDFDIDEFLERVEEQLDPDADEGMRDAFLVVFQKVRTQAKALIALDQAYFEGNTIVVHDSGSGMTAESLEACFLTIGTPNRLREKRAVIDRNRANATTHQVPLGEKGIGRLAAMRLGHHVTVQTGVTGEQTWSLLEMDWRPIFEDPELEADDLEYEVEVSDDAKPKATQGTTITIRDLQSNWSTLKLSGLAAGEFAKLADPFDETLANQFLKIQYQNEKVTIPIFDSAKLKHADAVCQARFDYSANTPEDDPLAHANLTVEVEYKRFKRSKTRNISGVHLASALSYAPARRIKRNAERLPDTDDVLAALKRLGPFEMKFYWFNRGRIQRENSTFWLEHLKPFVRAWSGGLLVYRDGYRVYPYGASADDWLDLDRKALAGSAFKLNRAQIVGYLRITTSDNPLLKDQTNREGFRDCSEKEALRRLLRTVIVQECRVFLEDVDKLERATGEETVEDIDTRLTGSHDAVVKTLEGLRERVPDEEKAIREALAQLAEVEDAWARAKATIRSHEDDLEQYLHLAGVGLMVEFIAHELARSTEDVLKMISAKDGKVKSTDLEMLTAQLKTIEKRVRVLDELSVPGRQRKVPCEMREIVQILSNFHQAKMARHDIKLTITETSKASFRRKVEKGQILQILDNLFSNSFFWLTHQYSKVSDRRITIAIDPNNQTLTFTDNGPGAPPDLQDEIFNAFVTSKPPGEGRGLGLYISSKLAEYNEATLTLGAPDKNGRLNSFVLAFTNP